ncbi:ATPase [Candidatus Kaiserbacteria bacterium RIFCSPHIGHO2_01_FULL_51_33]|uniref:ATPase n=1 Tax=Candidatus Kaiserbacteria bacterium RIFCSPLOWO2_01_FULL_51_21 TaxID=1798508 RepID=A0A1F6ECV9_9BACT|nr:MAG: ATPase [Candidatus Kaiserbacteria bacterium RIFCSPHIGHO2_01_FULL_51_33]OGG71513.1 MAG: ATPase [Candidatus Kaiserbacteria bacterium RIFCSPLOWO2_01_FULL_51_21]
MEHIGQAHSGYDPSTPLGIDKHAGHHTEDFLKKFWVTLALTVPIILYSDLPELFLSWGAPAFPGSEYLALVLGTMVFFYGGLVFLRGAVAELRARLPGMMTLIALAISAAYLYSIGSVFFGSGMTLFWELSTLIAVMLLGHFIEMKAVASAKGALRELAKLLPDVAEVIRGGKITTVSLADLRQGDISLVRPGGKVPADGIVVSGDSEVDESLITGESRPVVKSMGAEVIAGSINGDGSLQISIQKTGEQTFLAGVMRLVAEAETSKSRLQLLSDRAAFYLTILAVTAGGVTLVAWLAAGQSFGFAVERLVAVLVIACPHALGLAIPLVASISTTMAAKSGFFVKRRLALEAARSITTVLFDKTGTLTEGKFSVMKASSDETLALAAAVEAHSEHPIGKAIAAEAAKRSLAVHEATNFKRLPGVGAEATVGGKKVFVGHRGGTDIVVEVDGKAIGSISLADTARPEAKAAVAALQKMGLGVAMITGDSEEVAKQVATELGIEEYFARVVPEEKVNKVKLLQSKGERVAMVGDGVNDAPALTQADLGIAIGAGTNVAIESAGIILVRNDPHDIPKIIKLSKLTYTKMIQNLFWATGYNIVALPIAAGALAFKGIILEPAVAAVFMSLSTVIVAVNASLLRRAKL